MEKVLVIGGSGFIGANICKYLKNKNIYCSSYDIKKNDDVLNSYVGNILEDSTFENIVSKHDTIIYLITTVSPKKSMEDTNSSYVNDVPLLINTLDTCLKVGVRRVIFASSGGTIYGNNEGKSSSEDDQLDPINHYAICKLTCEKILQMYNKLYNMENISLRISNPYGIGQNPNSGVGVITTFVNQIVNEENINLFGNGDITRDFISVEEVAEAFYLAAIWDFDKTIHPIFNIGSGQGHSLKEIINIISDVLGIEPKINYLPEREYDVKTNVLNCSKAKEYLSFESSKGEEENIRRYIKSLYEENKFGKNRR